MISATDSEPRMCDGQPAAGRSINPVARNYVDILRTVLYQPLDSADAPRCIGVTGASRKTGVSTVTANLAEVAAKQCGLRTLLIDANFAHPFLANRFSTASTPGLQDLLTSSATIAEISQDVCIDRLEVIAAGNLGATGAVISPCHSIEALQAHFKNFDLILFDFPPVDRLAEWRQIADLCNGVLLLVESARTTSTDARRAKAYLESAAIPIIGAVLNKHS